MKTAQYEKNARAITQVRSWLGALKIPHKVSEVHGSDLEVTSRDGVRIELQLTTRTSQEAPRSAICIDSATITGRNIKRALEEFRALVELLGYEWSDPVNRGEGLGKKAHYTTDFELVAFRHSDFRRAPNPDPELFKQYAPIITRACWNFFRRYTQVCEDNMLAIEDLTVYGQVWTCNFLALYAVPSERVSDCDNEKLLTTYLNQRFSELRQILWKKGRNVFTHLDEAHIAMTGTTFEYGKAGGQRRGSSSEDGRPDEELSLWGHPAEEQEEIDENYVARHRELNTKTPNSRRTSADHALTQGLAALPHDKLVTILTEAMDNLSIHPDARREAASRLRLHAGTCSECDPASLPPSEEDEEVAGVEEGSAAE